jgi:hypothetical protein
MGIPQHGLVLATDFIREPIAPQVLVTRPHRSSVRTDATVYDDEVVMSVMLVTAA